MPIPPDNDVIVHRDAERLGHLDDHCRIPAMHPAAALISQFWMRGEKRQTAKYSQSHKGRIWNIAPSTPDCRPRRTLLHLSYSYALQCGPALLVTCQEQTFVTLLDHLVGNGEQSRRLREPPCHVGVLTVAERRAPSPTPAIDPAPYGQIGLCSGAFPRRLLRAQMSAAFAGCPDL
jgi:hypothetical protein